MTRDLILHRECGDGSIEEVALPHRWTICRHCRGEGASSAYLGALTQDDMEEQGPEFMEDYMAGAYDRTCDRCGGSGKVKEVDRRRCDAATLAAWDEQERDDAEYAAECAAERRAGC